MITLQIDDEQLNHLIQNALREVLAEIPKNNSSNQNERLTIAQFAEQYKISKATIHNLTKSGKLAFEKIGSKTLFLREDIEKYFQSKKKKLDKDLHTSYSNLNARKGVRNG